MTEISHSNTPISRREAEMNRSGSIAVEMASAVRLLGGDAPAKEANNKAARAARLPVTIIERLRWKKIKRPFADIVDAIREAVERHNEEGLRRAHHELTIANAKNAALLAYLEASDPDFYRPEIDRLRGQVECDRLSHDCGGAE